MSFAIYKKLLERKYKLMKINNIKVQMEFNKEKINLEKCIIF